MPSDQGFDHSDVDLDACIADDSTECDCSACTAAEDRFWREQQGVLDDEDRREPDGYIEPADGEDRP